MTYYKVKVKNGFLPAVGKTPAQQLKDAQKLVSRYGGKVLAIPATR